LKDDCADFRTRVEKGWLRGFPTGLMSYCILISHYAMDARFSIDRRRRVPDMEVQGIVLQWVDGGLN
jgi:hypothetical protein